MRNRRALGVVLAVAAAVSLAGGTAQAQLASSWMVPAVARTSGENGTFWLSDVSLHNPHSFDLPVVIHFLPTGEDNTWAETAYVTLYPYETFNLWDVLGEEVFNTTGTGALLVYADPQQVTCTTDEDCHFLVNSRTYTTVPWGGEGEFGQTIPGRSVGGGVDWSTYGYATGILNDGEFFRCNVGAASWSDADARVLVDVQDSDGNIIATEELVLEPFGHRQHRLQTAVSGGSLVFYLAEGADDALVFPYASVVNQQTGDPSFVPAQPSVVGVSVEKARVAQRERPLPQPASKITIVRHWQRQAQAE